MQLAPLANAVPYPWPWHGTLDSSRLALVVLRDGRWCGRDSAALPIAALVEAVAAVGGLVVVAGDPATARELLAGAVFVTTPATGAFHGSTLDDVLRRAGRTDLVLAGWGLEGPVHSTMRE